MNITERIKLVASLEDEVAHGLSRVFREVSEHVRIVGESHSLSDKKTINGYKRVYNVSIGGNLLTFDDHVLPERQRLRLYILATKRLIEATGDGSFSYKIVDDSVPGKVAYSEHPESDLLNINEGVLHRLKQDLERHEPIIIS